MGEARPGPLAGVKVLAFEHAWAVPYGTMMLADMGADVVKVEAPGVGDHVRNWTRSDLTGLSPHFLSVNRNKRSIVIDLKSESGREQALRLSGAAHVVMENLSPGALDRLGLGWSVLGAGRDDLIFCAVSGFGSTGPFRDRRAYDLLIQAEGGIMSVTGDTAASRSKVGVPVVDIMAAMVAAFSVSAAVRERERTGRGRFIDVSMLDVAASVMAFNLFSYGISGEVPVPMGSAHPLLAPYEAYDTATGPIVIAILTEPNWITFCDVIGRPELATDERFDSAPARVGNRDALNEMLRPLIAGWERDDLIEVLAGRGLGCARVNDVVGVLDHPQLEHRGFWSDWRLNDSVEVKAPGAPWSGGQPVEVRSLPPAVPGRDTDSVLADWLGCDEGEIADLRARGGVA